MYKALLTDLAATRDYIRPQPPCTAAQISAAQQHMGVVFPDQLSQLLLQVNGDQFLLMSLDEIIQYDHMVKEVLINFFEPDIYHHHILPYLYFAHNGCGDYYCFAIKDGRADDSSVLIWEHELMDTRPAAASIADLIKKYYTDRI